MKLIRKKKNVFKKLLIKLIRKKKDHIYTDYAHNM